MTLGGLASKRGLGLGAWHCGALDWQGADRGQNGACPVVKQKVAKAGLLIDGRVETADVAKKRPLGAS